MENIKPDLARKQCYLRFPHLVLYRQHYTDPLESENCRPEKERKLPRRGKGGNGVRAWERLGEYEVENYSQSNKLEDVGEDGAGGEVFEVADAADDDDGEEEDQDVHPVVPVDVCVSLHQLRQSLMC